MKKLAQQIQQWAKEKGIDNIEKQELKLIEELGELAKEINLGNKENQKNEIGDVFVVLVILAGMREKELDFEFRPTYNTIAVTLYQVLNHALNCFYSTAIDYLNDLARDLGHDLEECAQIAYNKISKRTGQTIDGQFIKDKV
jgi:NTP pyrophosphatase (non-canonical NTP hydrolase)